jgi:hypothetical protein
MSFSSLDDRVAARPLRREDFSAQAASAPLCSGRRAQPTPPAAPSRHHRAALRSAPMPRLRWPARRCACTVTATTQTATAAQWCFARSYALCTRPPGCGRRGPRRPRRRKGRVAHCRHHHELRGGGRAGAVRRCRPRRAAHRVRDAGAGARQRAAARCAAVPARRRGTAGGRLSCVDRFLWCRRTAVDAACSGARLIRAEIGAEIGV